MTERTAVDALVVSSWVYGDLAQLFRQIEEGDPT
jgi:hypothetical protein